MPAGTASFAVLCSEVLDPTGSRGTSLSDYLKMGLAVHFPMFPYQHKFDQKVRLNEGPAIIRVLQGS